MGQSTLMADSLMALPNSDIRRKLIEGPPPSVHDLHDERTHPLPTPGFVVFAARFSLFIIGAAIPWPQIATELIGRLVDSDVPECHLRQISHSRPSIKKA